MSIINQLDTIPPSVKDALFRRLLYDDHLGYLRNHDNTEIIGFEVDLSVDQELSGYTIIGIQKHTILAYKSDFGEDKKLILFPSLSKIKDPEFNMLDIKVHRKIIRDDTFEGEIIKSGTLKQVAKDLMPPYEKAVVSDELSANLKNEMRENLLKKKEEADESFASNNHSVDYNEPPQTMYDEQIPPDFDEPPMDVPPEFDEPFNDNFNETGQQEISKQQQLKSQTFNSISDLSDYCILNLNIPKDFVSNVLNAALQSTNDTRMQIDVAVLLFVKLYDEGKLQ